MKITVLTVLFTLLNSLFTAAHAGDADAHAAEPVLSLDLNHLQLASKGRPRLRREPAYPLALNFHAWSGDGRFLLLENHYMGSPIDTVHALYLMDTATQRNHQLCRSPLEGARDRGLSFSWASQYQGVSCQLRGSDLGFWHWRLPALVPRYQTGWPNPRGDWELYQLDFPGHRVFTKQLVKGRSETWEWDWRTPQRAPKITTEVFESGSLSLSQAQQQAFQYNGKQGYGETVLLGEGQNSQTLSFEGVYTLNDIGLQQSVPCTISVRSTDDGLYMERWELRNHKWLSTYARLISGKEERGTLQSTFHPTTQWLLLSTGQSLYKVNLQTLQLQQLYRTQGENRILALSISPSGQHVAIVVSAQPRGDQVHIFAF